MNSDRGMSAPLVLILVLALLGGLFYVAPKLYSSSSEDSDVMGAVHKAPGISVTVTSNSETWDLIEYLCRDLESCLESPDSGNRYSTVSGGKTDEHEVVISSSAEWQDYDYVKFYVKPGWNQPDIPFKVLTTGDAPGSNVHTLSDGLTEYEVVVLPTSAVTQNFYKSAHFSDSK